MTQVTIDVLEERINSLEQKEEIIHNQLSDSIKQVSNQLLEERKRTNGSLDEIHEEIKALREQEIKEIRRDISDLKTAMATNMAKNPSWKNSYIITFLSTLCGILLTYVITRTL